MSYTAYLDDVRVPKVTYDIVWRSSVEAISYMQEKGCPFFVSFDHDLGGEDTAMKVVKWMISQDEANPGWIPWDFDFEIHSSNIVGSKNIESYFLSYFISHPPKSLE